MPCDTVTLNQVELGKCDGALLKLACESLADGDVRVFANGSMIFFHDGVRVEIKDNVVTVPAGWEHLRDKIKVSYSNQVVRAAARAKGWQVREVAPNKLQVVRRY